MSCVEDFSSGGDQKVRLYVNNEQVDTSSAQRDLLPHVRDVSFEGYNRRMTSKHRIADYSLVIADWHQFSRELWERIVRCAAPICERVGVSASRMDTQVFLGTYKRTPFGVHVDPTSAFHFPLIGEKRMRFWPAAYAEDTPSLDHAQEYSAHLAHSISAVARPGQAIYWPSNYWHVGESEGDFSVTWRFAYWFADGLRRRMLVAASELLQQVDAGDVQRVAPPRSPDDTHAVDALLASLLNAASCAALRARVTASWLEQCSAFGFLRIPRPKSVPSSASQLRLRSPFSLLAAQVDAATWCFATAGISCVLPRPEGISELLSDLNGGCVVPTQRIRAAGLLPLCVESGAFEAA